MSLNAIKDRAWQIQACSALSGEGLSVSLTKLQVFFELNVFLILEKVYSRCKIVYNYSFPNLKIIFKESISFICTDHFRVSSNYLQIRCLKIHAVVFITYNFTKSNKPYIFCSFKKV